MFAKHYPGSREYICEVKFDYYEINKKIVLSFKAIIIATGFSLLSNTKVY